MHPEEHFAAPKLSRAEQTIYRDVYDVLTAGMLVSSALYVAGIILALVHPRVIPLTREFIMRNYRLVTVWHGLVHFRPGALMFLATVILILTPVSRVVISVYAFHSEGDRKYVMVTGIVLGVIILTVILGRLGLQ